MENKKDLGKLFKERLADTEIAPEKTLWSDIEQTLDRKKRRRFYIIWIASLLSVFLGGFLLMQIVTEEPVKNFEKDALQTAPRNTDVNSNFDKTESSNQDNEKIVIEKNTAEDSLRRAAAIRDTDNLPDTKLDSEQNDLETDTDSAIKTVKVGTEEKSELTRFKKARENGEVLKTKSDDSTGIKGSTVNTTPVKTISSNRNTDARRPDGSMGNASSRTLDYQNSGMTDSRLKNISKSADLKNDEPYTKKPLVNPWSEIANTDGNKKSLEGINEKRRMVAPNDSLPKDRLRVDTLAKTRPQPKKIERDSAVLLPPEEKKLKTYQAYPFVGTSSFGAFSKESAIDPRLNDNTKTSTPELSYGVLIIFEINEKLAVRIGALHNSLEKSTMNVPIDPNNLNTNYAGIEYAKNSSYVAFSNRFATLEEIVLQEKLSYLEIPLDITYNIWQNGKFRLDGVGGISVQTLTENEILFKRSSGESGVLGKNRSYAGGNIGLRLGFGLDYRINEFLQLHLEPILKPQIGFYENKIGNNPFILNIHFGLKYRL